jgi:predicted transcriptional regulator
MLDDKQLEKAIHDLILDICELMYDRGYDQVPVDAIMRLVGVDAGKASEHTGEYFALDQDFQKLLEQRRAPPVPEKTPSDATIH